MNAPEKIQKFPISLLQEPMKIRIQWFLDYIINHDKLEKATNKLIRYLLYPAIDCHIILVIGPGGVGKTTLSAHLQRKVIERLTKDNYVPDPGQILQPFFTHPARQRFDWDEFFEMCLKALHEVMLDKKIGYEQAPYTDTNGNFVIKQSIKKREYRKIFITAVSYRKPLYIGVDEGDHFTLLATGTSFETQLQLLKSTATDAHTTFVIFGTYELLVLLGANEQIDRRIRVVHLERYRSDNPDTRDEDIGNFRLVLNELFLALPLTFIPDFTGLESWFYDHCLGNVGILKDWLAEALILAIEKEVNNKEKTKNKKQVDNNKDFIDCCEMSRPPRGKLEQMLRKIQLGEAQMEAYEDSISEPELAVRLGSKYVPLKDEDKEKGEGNRLPGKRNPNRDQVGGGYN